mgnify:FL=1
MSLLAIARDLFLPKIRLIPLLIPLPRSLQHKKYFLKSKQQAHDLLNSCSLYYEQEEWWNSLDNVGNACLPVEDAGKRVEEVDYRSDGIVHAVYSVADGIQVWPSLCLVYEALHRWAAASDSSQSWNWDQEVIKVLKSNHRYVSFVIEEFGNCSMVEMVLTSVDFVESVSHSSSQDLHVVTEVCLQRSGRHSGDAVTRWHYRRAALSTFGLHWFEDSNGYQHKP